MKIHFIKEYLLNAALEKAGLTEVNAPYADAKFLANRMAEHLGESGRVSDRTLVRCFEDKEKWTDTWGYLAAFVLDKGEDFQGLKPTDKEGRNFLLRTYLKEYRTELEKEIQAQAQLKLQVAQNGLSATSAENSSLPNPWSRRELLKKGLYTGIGAMAGISLFSGYQFMTKKAALPPLNMLVNTHPGNELFWQCIKKWTDLLKENSDGRIQVLPRVLETEEKERKESLLQRLILGEDFSQRSFDLYCSVNYHDESDNSSLNFYGSIPFGMTSQEFNAWFLYEGKPLLTAYKGAYKIYLFGNSGQQMGGWFLKSVDAVADLENMTIRMHGLGASVLQRSANNLTVFRTFHDADSFVQKIKTEQGNPAQYAIEYMNAHTDEGLAYPELLDKLAAANLPHQALYLYEKGWHERGSVWTIKMNQKIYELLKDNKELLNIFEYTTQGIQHEITQIFEKSGREALRNLKLQKDTLPFQIKKFNRTLGNHFLQKTKQVLNEKYNGNKIYQSYCDFHKNWSGIDLQNGQILDEHVWEELFQ